MLRIVDVHETLSNGDILAVVRREKEEIVYPVLIVNRDTEGISLHSNDVERFKVPLRKGQKLEMLGCDPKPGHIFVFAEDENGLQMKVFLADVTPEKPFKGATLQIRDEA